MEKLVQISCCSDNFLGNFSPIVREMSANEMDPPTKYKWPLFVVPLRSLRSLRGNKNLLSINIKVVVK